MASTLAHVTCVLTGRPADLVDPSTGQRWQTSFNRQPVVGAIAVGPRGLAGDEVTDKVHHGRDFQALLMFAGSNYVQWRAELDLPEIGPGGFGENLTIDTLTEDDVCLGDHLLIGSAIFEVTAPRFPCKTIDRRWGMKGITARVAETGRGGWYVRVQQTGSLKAGDEVKLLTRPAPDLTITLAARAAFGPEPFTNEAERLLASPIVRDDLKQQVRSRIEAG